MKLYFYELYKLFCKRIVWLCILGLFIANAALYGLSSWRNERHIIALKDDAARIEAQYMDADYDELFVEIETQFKELEALSSYIFFSERVELETEQLWKDHFSKAAHEQLEEFPDLLEKYKDSPYYEDEELRSAYLQQLDIVYEQLVHITGYDEYLDGIDARAQQMGAVSIFNQEGSFSLNNIQQTPKDFLPLKGLELKLGREHGIMSATDFRLTDLFIPVILFLFCIFLFLHEHDTGLDKLVKTARNGRYPTIAARITALSTLAVVLSVLFYGSILIIGSYLYGFGDLSRYVQSMPSFQDCTIPMTVGQYLGLYLAAKAGAALITGALMSLIFIVFGEGKSVFAVLAVFAAVSFVCYEFIHAASWLNLLKYVNIFSAWDVCNFYRLYVNINFFSIPLNRTILCGWAGLLIFLVCVVITCVAYANHVRISFVERLLAIISRKVRRYTDNRPLHGSSSIAVHEWRKLLLTGRAVIIIAAAFVIACSTWDISPLTMGNGETAIYKLYANYWSGPLTDEKIREIEKESAYLLSIPDKLDDLAGEYRTGKISEYVYISRYNTLNNYLENREAGFQMFYDQYSEVLSLRKSVQPAIVDKLSSDYYYKNDTRDILSGLLLVLLIVLALGRVFPMEVEKGLSPILRCTTKGRQELTLSKIAVSLCCTVILWLLVYISNFATLLVKYNLSFVSDIQNIRIYADRTVPMTVGMFTVLMEGLRLLGALTAAVWTLNITRMSKKLSMGVILSAAILGLPFLLTMMGLPFMRWIGLTAAFTPYEVAQTAGWELVLYAVGVFAVFATGIVLLFKERGVKR